MTHLGADLLMGYARRTLDAEALLLADDHLSGCKECRGRLIDDDGLTTTVRSLSRDLAAARHAPTGHLPYDQIEARAEGRLRGAAREVAETHLEHCAPCAAQTRDLEGFATAFRDARPRAAVAGAAAAVAGNDAAIPGAPPAAGTAGVASGTTNGDAGGGRGAGETQRAARTPGPKTLRLSEEALAEEPTLRPAARGGFLFTEPGEEHSRAGMIVYAILGAAILVAIGYGGRAGWQRLTALKGKVQELERRNESLQAAQATAARPDEPAAADPGSAGDTAGATGEVAAAAPVPAPETTAPAVSARRALTIQDRKGPVGLDEEGDLVGFDGLPVAAGKILAAALRRGGVDVPEEIRSLAASRPVPADPGVGPEPAAQGADTVMTLATAAGTFVRSTRPVLSWKAVEGAKSYRVAVFDSRGTVIARGGPMRNTSWTVSRPLQRGATYEWRVVALRPAEAPPAQAASAETSPTEPADAGADGVVPAAAAPGTDAVVAAAATDAPVPAAAPPVAAAPRGPSLERIATGAARFKVLGGDESATLERGLRGAPGSRLVAGVLAARAGLLDDAERELRTLAEENPGSDVARGLLASVEAARLP